MGGADPRCVPLYYLLLLLLLSWWRLLLLHEESRQRNAKRRGWTQHRDPCREASGWHVVSLLPCDFCRSIFSKKDTVAERTARMIMMIMMPMRMLLEAAFEAIGANRDNCCMRTPRRRFEMDIAAG